MKCQRLFSGKNKKNIIKWSSAELAHRWHCVSLAVSRLKIRLLFKNLLLIHVIGHFKCI